MLVFIYMSTNFINEILNINFLNNSIQDYLIAFGFFIIFFIIFKIIQSILLKKLLNFSKHTKNDIDDTLIEILVGIKPGLYVLLSLFLAVINLNISDLMFDILKWILIISITYTVIIALQRLIDYVLNKRVTKKSGNTAQAIKTLGIIVKVILWVLALLFLLSNMGINVSSVIAGLGIGGIAVALALQNILTDLFSSFAIYFDKPFEVGDFIIVNDKVGVVEKIGIKTTRIRALQGEEIVISNKELTSSQIQNFKKLTERRIVFGFGLVYGTSNEKLKKVKNIVEDIFEKIENTRLDRCHFSRFDDSALFFEVVYFVDSPEYNIYMDIQEKINLELKDTFEKEKIEMAFPTRTVHLVK